MFPGPVFLADMRSLSRRARYFVARSLLGLILLFLVWIRIRSVETTQPIAGDDLAELARELFATAAVAQMVVVAVLTPALVAPTIAEERSRRTLGYLLSSSLSGWEIAVGKLASRLILIFTLLASTLPVFSIFTLFGGIDPLEVVAIYATSAAIAVFLAGLAIAVSTVSKEPREAVFIAYGLEAFWLAAAPLLDGPIRAQWPAFLDNHARLLQPILLTNPLTALNADENIPILIAALLSAGTILVLLSALTLRSFARAIGDGPRPARSRFRFWRRRPIGDNPMLWKETQVSHSHSRIGKWTRAGLFLLVFIMMALMIRDAVPSFRESLELGYGEAGLFGPTFDFNSNARGTATALYLLALIATTAAAATSITTEREADTWTGITSSPLEPTEILKAKRKGIYRRMKFFLAAPPSIWLLGLISGAVHPFGFICAILIYPIYIASAVALGMLVSLYSRSSAKALTIAIAITIVLHGGYLLVCMPLARESPLTVMGCTPFLIHSAPMSYGDIRSFTGNDGSEEYRSQIFALFLAGLFSIPFFASLGVFLRFLAIKDFEVIEDRPSAAGSR